MCLPATRGVVWRLARWGGTDPAMRLLAISDLHVRHSVNREAWAALADHGDDWLILGGDISDTEEELAWALDIAVRRFAKVFWVPGNHELWTTTPDGRRGEERYRALVRICNQRGVSTPEDPFVLWSGPGGAHLVAPLFVLYDYSFRPPGVTLDGALDWARESGVMCADELYLHPDPYPSREAWCEARCRYSEARLEQAAQRAPLVLINHFPLRREVANVPLYPRFVLWCGTTRTADWHRRFGARVVVSGHLHIPSTRLIDGVRFEEVSFGYPNQRRHRGDAGLERYLREILPGPAFLPDRSSGQQSSSPDGGDRPTSVSGSIQ